MAGMILAALALSAAAAPLSATAALAQPQSPKGGETLVFDAPSYAHFGEFRQGKSKLEKASVTLWLPPGEAKVPAVMIAHTIGGWRDAGEGKYVQPLLDAGYAVLGLDHFTGRGITRAADVAGAISPISPASDALLALQRVADHPRLDAGRIALIGFSMGGVTTELTANEFIRSRILGTSLRFAAHVSVYAPCSYIFSNGSNRMTTGAPMLRLQGGKDETAPAEKCALIETLIKQADPAVQRRTIIYPEAYHAWDQAFFSTPKYHPHHVNARLCPVVDFGAAQRFYKPDGGIRPFDPTEFAGCLKASAGYTMGYDAAVTQKAGTEMLAFLAEQLKP
ncbi:dienelactone hydrolase family protein [Ferrovibrio sp.]|uniref:dienelactone hydrolase family protein n=1 Tax=Ferrovibrio sp. TaxID=1917215 RepID=UPI003D09931E